MKSKVYSWRLSEELKSSLERQARLRKVPVSSILDLAVREWLKKSALEVSGDEEQRKLHAAAERCFGTIGGLGPYDAERVRETVRRRLREKYVRQRAS
jgi:hypothetical protein